MRIMTIPLIIFQILTFGFNIEKGEKVFVLKDTKIYRSDDMNSEQGEKLNFLQNITIVEDKVSNNLVKVSVENEKEGWVDPNHTSIIPKTWIGFNKIEKVILYHPSKHKFKFVKGTRKGGIANKSKAFIQHKLFNDEYVFLISITNNDIEKYITKSKKYEEQLGGDVENFRKINFGKRVGYYYSGLDAMEGKKTYKLFIQDKNNILYSFTIFIKKTKQKDYELEAKKILFSFRLE